MSLQRRGEVAMAGKGSAPGERRGGRAKGVKNLHVLEREIVQQEITKTAHALRREESIRRIERDAKMAAQVLREYAAHGKKLAKERLDEFMELFVGRAAHYQPRPDKNGKDQNPTGNEAKFEKWALHAVDVAHKLAPYQSPTFRAIVVSPPPPSQNGGKKRFTLTIVDNHNGRVMPAEATTDDLDG